MDTQSKNAVHAVVCIPTFQRPEELRRTLESVVSQETDFGFAVIVVDNDGADPVGARMASTYLGAQQLPHKIIVEANQGNCFAINSAFALALREYSSAEYVLMIDDDEAADPGWLAHMVQTATHTQASVVGGPVRRVFSQKTSAAISEHVLFGSIEGPTRQIDIIHGSGNCLIRRAVFSTLQSPQFDLRFNFLGGGDMEFFTRCKAADLAFWWCAEAGVTEYVTSDRISKSWLMQRSIRTGSINFMIDRVRANSWRDVVFINAKNFMSLGLGLVRSAISLIKHRRLLSATHPILMPVGRMLAGFGVLPVPYKAKE